jgi:N-acyl-D-amino-acid deacylase
MHRTWTAALVALTLPLTARADDESLRNAISKGLKRLQDGSASYTTKRQCFSCHHQAISMIAFRMATARGFTVESEKLKAQVDFTLKTFAGRLDKVAKGQTVAGGSTTVAYALFALEGARHPADATTAALVEYLLVRQKDDGSWQAQASRPPSEGSRFTDTALALRLLRHYGPSKDVKDAEELRKRIDVALEKGREWLRKSRPVDTEDKLWRLRGLVSAGVNRVEIDAARNLLLKEQLKDGSWAQLADKPGDAYATGAVLVALRQAGVKTTDEAYQRGVRYLLKTQRDDGAWLVETRSRPVQVFFDNGDPGGKSQFISFLSTGWAVLALLEAFPEK